MSTSCQGHSKPVSKLFYSQLYANDSSYYLDDEFNGMLQDQSISSNFSLIFHANARSLPKNLDDLTTYLYTSAFTLV